MIKDRNEKGLSLLYDNYAPTLLGLIFNVLGDKKVAEEVLQQTMLKVWDNIQSYDENKSTFFTWMAAIARNSAIDTSRLKSFQRQRENTTIQVDDFNRSSTQTNTSKIDVEKITEKLETKYKDVLDMVYLMGYTHQETAKQLDLPLGTVKSRLRLAIKTLKEELNKEKKLFIGFFLFSLLIILIFAL